MWIKCTTGGSTLFIACVYISPNLHSFEDAINQLELDIMNYRKEGKVILWEWDS